MFIPPRYFFHLGHHRGRATRQCLSLCAAVLLFVWALPSLADGFTNVAPMVTGRMNHTATLLPSGKVLVVGGMTADSTPLASAELYDPATNTWSSAGSLATSRTVHVAALLPSGKVLVAGGAHGDSNPIASVEIYDPASNSWTLAPSLATERYAPAVAQLDDGKVLVVGGATFGGTRLASAELYDPAAGTWSSAGSLATPRINLVATRLASGKVLVAAGELYRVLASAEIYDPASNTWSTAASLSTARLSPQVSLLRSGEILISGGADDGRTSLATAETYDSIGNSWTLTNPLVHSTYAHTQTELSSGQVLVAGGYDGNTLNDAQLYDPVSRSWSATGSLNVDRYGHSATLLPSGSVLVVGGYSRSSGSVLTSAEIYGPIAPPNSAPIISDVSGPASVAVGASATITASFTDVDAADTHTCVFDWGDASTSSVTAAGSGNGSCAATHTYTGAGTYAVTVVVSDSAGASATGSFSNLVVYNHSGTFADANLWIGLRNSDDQGTSFDLRTEVRVNSTLVASGLTRCIAGVTLNPAKAKQVQVPFAQAIQTQVTTGDVITFKLLARIGTNADDSKCAGHNNATGLQLYYDANSRASRFTGEITPAPSGDFFLHSAATDYFDALAPAATSSKTKASGALNFAGGNAWKEVGTWSGPVQ